MPLSLRLSSILLQGRCLIKETESAVGGTSSTVERKLHPGKNKLLMCKVKSPFSVRLMQGKVLILIIHQINLIK